MKQKEGFSDPTGIIMESIADGVFTVDREWRITSFNRAAEEITGFSRRQALGRYCREIFRASICETGCALKQTMETGCPVVNRAVYIVNAKGKRVPISISTGVLKSGRTIIGGVETFRDLSAVEELRKELSGRYAFADMISKNRRMQQIFEVLPEIAKSDSAVLIEGPTGSGKELLARAIHNLSPRKNKPFVAVNCAALPDTLLESELFGYEAGAFTDAKKSKPGRFARAQGGTLLLDEIGDIPAPLQVKLLRVLQEKEYEPLGTTRPVKADVRILAATNKNLAELMKKGLFRRDLYYRINVLTLVLPPLTERTEDIPLLVEHLIGRFNALKGKDVVGISEDALAVLMQHDFPGNVRELENIIEHAFILIKGGLIRPRHLPGYLQNANGGLNGFPGAQGQRQTLAEMEARLIGEALLRNNFKRLAAARELGIDKTTLWRKIKRYGIKIPGLK